MYILCENIDTFFPTNLRLIWGNGDDRESFHNENVPGLFSKVLKDMFSCLSKRNDTKNQATTEVDLAHCMRLGVKTW